MGMKTYAFTDWEEFDKPTLVGTLRSSRSPVIKGKEHFNFSYDNDWLLSLYT